MAFVTSISVKQDCITWEQLRFWMDFLNHRIVIGMFWDPAGCGLLIRSELLPSIEVAFVCVFCVTWKLQLCHWCIVAQCVHIGPVPDSESESECLLNWMKFPRPFTRNKLTTQKLTLTSYPFASIALPRAAKIIFRSCRCVYIWGYGVHSPALYGDFNVLGCDAV
jgi:hypothetical protein